MTSAAPAKPRCSGASWNRPISVHRLGEMPLQSCGRGVSAARGKAGARLTAHTELRTPHQRSAREAICRNRPIRTALPRAALASSKLPRAPRAPPPPPPLRGIISSTFQLNLSAFSRDALGAFIDKTAQLEPESGPVYGAYTCPLFRST